MRRTASLPSAPDPPEAESSPPPFSAELIRTVSAKARRVRIDLVGCFLSLVDDRPLPGALDIEQIDPSIDAQGSWDIDREAGVLGAVISYRVNTSLTEDPLEGRYFIGVEFRATYQLESAVELTDEALECFAVWNGQFNTWPYMREMVQSLALKAGLGEVSVPLYRSQSPYPSTSDDRAGSGQT
jgi:hypothetical protein